MNKIILTVMRYLDNPESVSEAEHSSNVAYANSVAASDSAYAAHAVDAVVAADSASTYAADSADAAANGNYPTANKLVEKYFTRSGEDKGVYYEAVKSYTPTKPTKPIYTQEMHESGMLPPVGSYVRYSPDNYIGEVISVSPKMDGTVTVMPNIMHDGFSPFVVTRQAQINRKTLTPLWSIEEKLEEQLIGDGMTQESAKIFIGRIIAGDYVGLKLSGK